MDEARESFTTGLSVSPESSRVRSPGSRTVLLTGTAIAHRLAPAPPASVLEATHLPPLLTVPGEQVELRYDVFCSAPEDAPDAPCSRGGLRLRAEWVRGRVSRARAGGGSLRGGTAGSRLSSRSRSRARRAASRTTPSCGTRRRATASRCRRAARRLRRGASRSIVRSTSRSVPTRSASTRSRSARVASAALGLRAWPGRARTGPEPDSDRRVRVRRLPQRGRAHPRRGQPARPALGGARSRAARFGSPRDQRNARGHVRRARRHDPRARDDQAGHDVAVASLVRSERQGQGGDDGPRARSLRFASARATRRSCSSSRRASGRPRLAAVSTQRRPES